MNEDVAFNGVSCIKYNPEVYYDEIHFKLDGDDLLLAFYVKGERMYLHKNDRNQFVIDFTNKFKPLKCKDFRHKKINDILLKIGINFGSHLKAGMIEIKQYLKDKGRL